MPKSSLYLKEAVHLYPNSGKLHDRLSYVLAQESQQPGEEEKLDLALMHAREATKLDPKSTSAFCNLGSVLLLKQDSKGATAAYRNAIELNPQSPDAYFLLGSALDKNDDKQAANEALKKFIELAPPQDPRQKLAKQKLESTSH